jgi:hypothetical protein
VPGYRNVVEPLPINPVEEDRSNLCIGRHVRLETVDAEFSGYVCLDRGWDCDPAVAERGESAIKLLLDQGRVRAAFNEEMVIDLSSLHSLKTRWVQLRVVEFELLWYQQQAVDMEIHLTIFNAYCVSLMATLNT